MLAPTPPGPPRQIGLIFSSLQKETQTTLMLMSYARAELKNKFELFVMTTLLKGSPFAERLQELVLEHGAKIIYLDPMTYSTQKFVPSYIPFMNKRILYQRDWMRSNPLDLKPGDRVFISDEDIFFRSDVFEVFDEFSTRELFLFSEKTGFTNADGYNEKYMDLTTNVEAVKTHVKARQVYCMGFVAGTVDAVRQLMERLVVSFITQGFPKPVGELLASDQGAFNMLIHTGLLDDLQIQLVDDSLPYVAHLTAQLDRDDLVDFAIRHSVVHQYKWARAVKEWIQQEYGIDATTL